MIINENLEIIRSISGKYQNNQTKINTLFTKVGSKLGLKIKKGGKFSAYLFI